jgi:hypothetical protein
VYLHSPTEFHCVLLKHEDAQIHFLHVCVCVCVCVCVYVCTHADQRFDYLAMSATDRYAII